MCFENTVKDMMNLEIHEIAYCAKIRCLRRNINYTADTERTKDLDGSESKNCIVNARQSTPGGHSLLCVVGDVSQSWT